MALRWFDECKSVFCVNCRGDEKNNSKVVACPLIE